MKLHEIKKTAHPKYAKTEVQPYMYQTKEEIEDWMKRQSIQGFVSRELTIHPSNTSIDFDRFGRKKEDVLIQHNGKWMLPVQFHLVGRFDISGLEVESPIGFPYVIMEQLQIKGSKLASFEGFPKVVPEIIGSSKIKMNSFKGLEETNCKKLIWTGDENIDSLDGLPPELEVLYLTFSNTTFDLQDILARCPNLTGLALGGNDVKIKKILSIFKFKKIKEFYFRPGTATHEQAIAARNIINKHLTGDRNIIACQEELFKQDLDDFAS